MGILIISGSVMGIVGVFLCGYSVGRDMATMEHKRRADADRQKHIDNLKEWMK